MKKTMTNRSLTSLTLAALLALSLPLAATAADEQLQLGPWHTTGPLPVQAFNQAMFPEQGVDLTAKNPAGQALWTPQPQWTDGQAHVLPAADRASTYLFRTLTTDKPAQVSASLGSDDGLEVWLNGRKLLSQDVLRGVSLDSATVVLDLQPGANGLLLKIHNQTGDHGFAFSLAESLNAYNQRMQWFADAQYGMFIHFGLYSQLGGEWKGEQADGYAEWIQAGKNIPREEYAPMIRDFNPKKFDSDLIARTAKEAGMTYLVITSKHHEGFCLWDSKHTDFDVAGSPFKGRDILGELAKACEKHGLKFGIYYSIIDWHHPSQTPSLQGQSPFHRWGQTLIGEGLKDEYIAYQTNQILELIKNYKPAMLWFDGDWASWWTMEDGSRLYSAIRGADPSIIVNNRVAKRGGFELDFVTQEQEHFKDAFPKHWEGCYTMNESWGYKKHDHSWKNAETVYNKLKDINTKGGNLLLNVGPDGNGEIQPEAIAILKETAALLKANPIKKAVPEITKVPGVVAK